MVSPADVAFRTEIKEALDAIVEFSSFANRAKAPQGLVTTRFDATIRKWSAILSLPRLDWTISCVCHETYSHRPSRREPFGLCAR